jgi:hypothetical protein
MGLVFAGERVVFRGKDLFNELRDVRWMELFLLGITGRRFNDRQIRLFETIWSLGTSYPDPRIWNNRVASLAGTARSTANLGISAAVAVSEASIYGRRPDVRAIDFLLRTQKKRAAGHDLWQLLLAELERTRGIPGYGRPLVNRDERIQPVYRIAQELGFGDGPHLNLIFEIEDLLLANRYRIRMNAAALGAALAADQGLSVREYYMYLIPSFLGGMFPCYIESASREEGIFLPISCDQLAYEGREPRAWE